MKHTIWMLVLAFCLAGCGGSNRPEDTVNGFFNTLKSAEFEKLPSYMDGDSNIGQLTQIKAEGRELVKAMFGTVQTEFGKSEISGDKAKIEIKLSFVDVQAAMKNFEGEFDSTMKALMQKIDGNNKDLVQLEMQQEVLKLFKKAMSAPNAPRQTEESSVNLVKVGNAWKLSRDQDFGENLFEGLDGVLRLMR